MAPAVPLVVDAEDGAALESSRGSLFVVREGVVVTPPADGRLLPGITRAQAIEVVRALGVELREEAVDLARADEVFMTGAVRGVEPVASCEGVADMGFRRAHGASRCGAARPLARASGSVPTLVGCPSTNPQSSSS